MEKHELDSVFKDKISTSNDFYDFEADNAKQRIWSGIRPQKRAIPLFYRVLAAACILLLIGLSVVTYYNLTYKSEIKRLVESNTILKLEKQNLESKGVQPIANSRNTSIDTVYIEKKVVELKPVVTTTQITDTVYVKQVVYVKKEQDDNLKTVNDIAANQNSNENNIGSTNQTNEIAEMSNTSDRPNQQIKQKDAQVLSTESYAQINNDSFAREIIIENKKTSKKKKSRKFKVRFGGKRTKIEKETLALSTKLSN